MFYFDFTNVEVDFIQRFIMKTVLLLLVLAVCLSASMSADYRPRNPSVAYDIALLVEPIDTMFDTTCVTTKKGPQWVERTVEFRYQIMAVPMGSWKGDTLMHKFTFSNVRRYDTLGNLKYQLIPNYSRSQLMPAVREGEPLVLFYRRNETGVPLYAGWGLPEEVQALARLCNRGEVLEEDTDLDSLFRETQAWRDTTSISPDSIQHIVKVSPLPDTGIDSPSIRDDSNGLYDVQHFTVIGHCKGSYPRVGTTVQLSFETGEWRRSNGVVEKSKVRNRRNLIPPKGVPLYLYYSKLPGSSLRSTPRYYGFASEEEVRTIQMKFK